MYNFLVKVMKNEKKKSELKLQKLEILNIDIQYIEALWEADKNEKGNSRVYYNPKNPRYGVKPYIGIFVDEETNTKYAIPYTSAKAWHKSFLEEDPIKGILLTQIIDTKEIDLTEGNRYKWVTKPLDPNDSFFQNHPEIKDEEKHNYRKRIKNFLDFERMIPLAKGTYKPIDLTIKGMGKEFHDKKLYTDQLRLAGKHQTMMTQSASDRYHRQIDLGQITSHNEPDLKKLDYTRQIWEEYKKKEPKSKFTKYLQHKYNTKDIKEAIQIKQETEAKKEHFETLLKDSEFFCAPGSKNDPSNEKSETDKYIE